MRTRALLAVGFLLVLQGEFARARAVLEQVLALAEQRQDPAATARALTYLGLRANYAGEVAEATPLLQEARRRWEALGDPIGLGMTGYFLGYAADVTGDVEAAAARYTEALRWLEGAGDAQTAGFGHCYLAEAEWRRGELPRAVEHIQAAVRISVALWNRTLLSFAAQATVALVGARVEPAAWARLLGAADALFQATGAAFPWERMPAGQDVARLTQGEWAAAYREGRSLPAGDVVRLALHLLGEVAAAPSRADAAPEPAPQPTAPSTTNPLSEREWEVLRLVAEGYSSKAIGRQLFLSPSTVNHHLKAIFNKLTVDTRAQAVAVAARRGLL